MRQIDGYRRQGSCDNAAVTAMRVALNTVGIDGTIVIGEGEMDEAPMLYIGEKVGNGKGPKVDVAVILWKGPAFTKGLSRALAVIAVAEQGACCTLPICIWIN